MDQTIFWVWNGWGVLFTGCLAFAQFIHTFVTVQYGSGTPLRNIYPIALIGCVALVFVFSGWIAGLLAYPISVVIGVLLAQILIPKPS